MHSVCPKILSINKCPSFSTQWQVVTNIFSKLGAESFIFIHSQRRPRPYILKASGIIILPFFKSLNHGKNETNCGKMMTLFFSLRSRDYRVSPLSVLLLLSPCSWGCPCRPWSSRRRRGSGTCTAFPSGPAQIKKKKNATVSVISLLFVCYVTNSRQNKLEMESSLQQSGSGIVGPSSG